MVKRADTKANNYPPPLVSTSTSPSETVEILVQSVAPATGTVITTLATGHHNSRGPLLTNSIPRPSTLLQTTNLGTPLPRPSPLPTPGNKMATDDIFGKPIDTRPPPSHIKTNPQHPAPRLGIQGKGPFATNKFYGNTHLGTQSAPTHTHPYSIQWAKGGGPSASWGMSISHIDANQRHFDSSDPAKYFINPVGIQSVVISATELHSSTVLTTANLTHGSVEIQLRTGCDHEPIIRFPLCQGMGFVTGIFNGGTPLIQTGVFLATGSRKQLNTNTVKFKLQMEDGKTWLLYATGTKGDPLDLQVLNNGAIKARGPFCGIIQVAKDPGGGEVVYDAAAGAYPTEMVLTGTAQSMKGTYNFKWTKAGLPDKKLLMFALPHHVASFDAATKGALTPLRLQTTTKGVGTAVSADSWTMVEDQLPISMAFAPWSPTKGSIKVLSPAAKEAIKKVAVQELSQDMDAQTNLNSMYFSGKALAKFAQIVICVNDLLGEKAIAQAGLKKLEAAMARWVENRQKYPLVYESAWGGIVSSASYSTGNPGDDFGNTYYNDHHFHNAYHVYTAAVIAHLNSDWLAKNKEYVNSLVRDYANPSNKDPFFPVSRNFDYYAGHSWAHGLFESYDGKDQESSSEDAMAAYAVKMWGMVSGDAAMAARGNLMLSILKRSLNLYYLYRKDNVVQPAKFIGNKVAGILFENKIDHTTYFGTNIEYIQGIHMIPLMSFTQLTRDKDFVQQEWEAYFNNGRVDKIEGGWRGILYGNLATFDPKTAYKYFSGPTFNANNLDGGASLTWYMSYAAAMGGA